MTETVVRRGVNPKDVKRGRHYWFAYQYQDTDVPCLIKVSEIFGEVVWGRVLDTSLLIFFFSRNPNILEEYDEKSEEYQAIEVHVEHLVQEASIEEIRYYQSCMEENIKEFFLSLPRLLAWRHQRYIEYF